ncbi:MAG TPA: sulfite exporter TauE/SafE family protein, partial [Bacilli bacterium]|nr:sulfite exporter TauE/SafE family protein [Bacilli bacterium]
MEWFILLLIGLTAGTVGSLMGLGGGIIVVPSLMLLSGYLSILNGITPQVVVGTSLLIMIFTGLSATLAYIKQKKVDYTSGLIFLIGSIPGALFGVFLNKHIDAGKFLIFFGIFVLFVSVILMVRKYLKPLKVSRKGMRRTVINEVGQEVEYGLIPYIAIPISFIIGMFSGLFGIGGGTLMVPAMILIFGFPPHIAVATSMFILFFASIASSISHIALGNVNWLYAIALVPGAWFGG